MSSDDISDYCEIFRPATLVLKTQIDTSQEDYNLLSTAEEHWHSFFVFFTQLCALLKNNFNKGLLELSCNRPNQSMLICIFGLKEHVPKNSQTPNHKSEQIILRDQIVV